MRDVMEVLPFQNNMVMVRIQGMHITTMLQRMIWRLMEVEASVNGWPGSFAQVCNQYLGRGKFRVQSDLHYCPYPVTT